MNNESERFYFIAQRDGFAEAVAWETRTADIYRNAAVQSADSDAKGGAKGMEWAEKYCQSAKDCDEYAA